MLNKNNNLYEFFLFILVCPLNDVYYAVCLFFLSDKLAALWPFLGICAEVIILCAIILIYEKKRNKAEMEESDTDQSPDR